MTKEEYEDLPCIKVLRLFEEEFTKELVDSNIPQYEETIVLEDSTIFDIIIRFPKVTVSNENGDSVDIYDLFVKVPIDRKGALKETFSMVRSTYTYAQYISNYAHSHLAGIINNFRQPCCGSGPIVRTMSTLKKTKFNLQLWGLFIFELQKYVTVESLEGGPYNRITNISDKKSKYPYFEQGGFLSIWNTKQVIICKEYQFVKRGNKFIKVFPYYNAVFIHEFIKYLMSLKIVNFTFCGDRFDIGDNPNLSVIKISNAFIEYINNREDLTSEDKYTLHNMYFTDCNLNHDTLYVADTDRSNIEQNIGTIILKFKGEEIKLKILDLPYANSNIYNVIKLPLYRYIVFLILNILNVNYGKTELSPTNTRYFI